MSLWDRFLAPGDIRARRSTPPPPPASSHDDLPQLPIEQQEPRRRRLSPADRLARQNNILYTGLAFTALSILLTRRVLARKRAHDTLPPMSLPPKSVTGTTVTEIPEIPVYTGPKIHGPGDAVQAFGLATMHVFSLAMVGLGVAGRVFDIGDMEDLRAKVGRRKAKRYGEADGGIEGVVGDIFSEEKKEAETEGKTG